MSYPDRPAESPPPIYDAAMDTLDESIDAARSLIDGAQAIIVLTGAGISTDSGIPDFRGPNDRTRTLLPSEPRISTSTSATRRCGAPTGPSEPRDRCGRMSIPTPVIRRSSNSSGERSSTPSSPKMSTNCTSGRVPLDRVIEIHGTTRKVACLECDYRDDMETVLDRVRAGEADLPCPNCGGILKSATISSVRA